MDVSAHLAGRYLARAAAALTPQRVRGQAVVLTVSTWMAVALAGPLGVFDKPGNRFAGDFVHFYVIGHLALHHETAALYDEPLMTRRTAELVPRYAGARYLPVNSPQLAMIFAPIAMLPYGPALVAWVAITAAIYLICCYVVWRGCPHLGHHGPTVFLLALGFPGFMYVIAFGQNSAIALACVTAALAAFRAGRPFAAGLAIGALAYKPHYGLVAAAVFAATLNWRVVSGAVVSLVVQLLAVWMYFGAGTILDYARALRALPTVTMALEPIPYQMLSLRTFFDMLVPWTPLAGLLYFGSAAVLTALAVLVWRSAASLSVRYAVLWLTSALAIPHFYVYDLVIVAPALLLAADVSAVSTNQRLAPLQRVAIYACCVLPLAGPLARITHIQLATIALVALTLSLVAEARTATSVQPLAGE